MLLFFLIIFLIYYLSVLVLLYGWNNIPCRKDHQDSKTKAYFISIVVSVRNEAKNIHNLLASLESQTYPQELYEVIFIDDQSEDSTSEIIEHFKAKNQLSIVLIKNNRDKHTDGSPKKAALTKGVSMAQGDIILTTDGDCWMQEHWLHSMVRAFDKKSTEFVSGPVVIVPGKELLSKIQSLEFASLIGSGAAMIRLNYPLMCNGANLAFRKSAFIEVGGYEGKDHHASGDDVFLMHKIYKGFPQSIIFNKSKKAIVYTGPEENFKNLITQRRRWASKWKSYQLTNSWIIPVFLFVHYLAFLALIVVMFIHSSMIFPGILLISLKIITDYIFLKKVLNFCNLQMQLTVFLLSSLLYPIYTLTIGILVQFGKWSWKGRKYKS